MDSEFVETVCKNCPKSIIMNNIYGVVGVHCLKVNAPNYKACGLVKNCPLGKSMR
jgi:hypothetical protein